VGHIIERVVAHRLAPERLVGLRRIGIDEFSYRKGPMCRRAFGFHSERPVIGMLFLCCSDSRSTRRFRPIETSGDAENHSTHVHGPSG
jgi:hypothetical protein